MPLKDLANFNAEQGLRRAAEHAAANKNRLNGIACPNCGEQLSDGITIDWDADPKTKSVKCLDCGWQGVRTF